MQAPVLTSQNQGYYRFPTLHQDQVVFASEDDLWRVPLSGGAAVRLTANLGKISCPLYSPDGQWIAFIGSDEGHEEVYLIPAIGGVPRRLTYFGTTRNRVVAWKPDSSAVICSSNAQQSLQRQMDLFEIPVEGGVPKPMHYGMAHQIAYGPGDACVIGRHTWDVARWKRYKGGTKGFLWIDKTGDGNFEILIDLAGNMASPMWVGDRIYFISDHEDHGNLYSCTLDGTDLQRHTHHEDFFVRFAQYEGEHIVYQCGADLYAFHVGQNQSRKIEIQWASPQVQRNRKFVSPAKYLNYFSLHPKAHSIALVSRGKTFAMPLWDGAAQQYGEKQGVRYRTVHYLPDGKRMVMFSDRSGEEGLEIHTLDHSEPPVFIEDFDGFLTGRPDHVRVSPVEDQLAFVNHRNELVWVDLKTKTAKVLDSNEELRGIGAPAWSPDGRWIAYSYKVANGISRLRLCEVSSGATHDITEAVNEDDSPCFDPEGKYLYFISSREFNPAYDALHFSLGFPFGSRPYLVTLQADLRSPFSPDAAMATAEAEDKKDDKAKKEDGAEAEDKKDGDEKSDKPEPITIDLDGIQNRVVAFPVKDGRYYSLRAIKGKVMYLTYGVHGTLDAQFSDNAQVKGTLQCYDLDKREQETLVGGLNSYGVSPDGSKMALWDGSKLRVVKAGEKPAEKMLSAGSPGQKSGLIDFGRIRLGVVPVDEWKQMFNDAWRRMRDHFWTENMSGVDWEEVRQRYTPLLDRLAARTEYADLMWEVQGELGTSHAYEMGGDYRPEPAYRQGYLGADVVWDDNAQGYKITHIVRGDHWDEKQGGPLAKPGLCIAEGDILLAINGELLSPEFTPGEALVNQVKADVLLRFRKADSDEIKTAQVRTLSTDAPARYRDWVNANRAYVHEKSGGKIGYVHIPDMGANGFAEFHRTYLRECQYPALLVDVRFNGGGHVSQLLLDKLSRKRLGYDIPRWGKPEPYPSTTVMGPMLALTDENAGSDGDIFSHSFKMMKLGPLVGKRTWGGVIGIDSRGRLVDGSVTTQPEYSFWFHDMGWNVENYGTDPDIEVDYAPHHYRNQEDPQLDRSIAELEAMMQANPVELPDFSQRPDLKRKPLPDSPKA